MSENIEREIKISLTQEQYKTAEKLFQWGKIIEQTNFYYIPQRDSGMTSIRVRQIGDRYFLQLKAPISENGALHVKKEYEQQLDNLPETLTAQELSQLVGRDFPAADLAGSLHTQRRLCTDFDHVEICLDKSEYLGLTDYELELEYTADYPEKPLEILKNAGITQGEALIFAYLRSFSMKKHPQPAKVWAIMIIDSDVIICYYIKVLKRMKWYFDDTRKEVNNEKIYF